MKIEILPTHLLSEQQFIQMCELYCPHHHVTPAELRLRAIHNIDRIALFYHPNGHLTGFLGFRFREIRPEGQRKVAAFYMGMAYIHPSARGKNLVQKTVIRFLLHFRLRNPFTPLIFWTDAISYKPYMIFARNLRSYFPTRHADTPRKYALLRDQLGQIYYGDAYHMGKGTVAKDQNRLRAGVAEISTIELADPDIHFYATQNPGHAKGDGLIVLCPASTGNVLSYLFRQIKRNTKQKSEKQKPRWRPSYQ